MEKVEDNRISLHKSIGTPISGVSYTFDHVFDQDCSNARVYDLLTKDVIHAALKVLMERLLHMDRPVVVKLLL
ncbi:hypothetical protein K7X08_002028 [Anisodus acutangulus]|uniref:Uncharacterized protein n=1 Tax=Anisodus acutangulus TaxID=402998 RepID=A0A9Q1LS69_9SOLA|nr:hypothetical protein K7X08_002028 [Anisodus acutangulus]